MLQEKLVEIEDCRSKRRLVKTCFRKNIVPKNMIKEYPNCKMAQCDSNTLRTEEKKETHIKDLSESIAPEW